LVGNDVVDLDEPDARGAHLRERLVHRVLTESERARLASSTAPHALFWMFFAAKEAAYKVVTKLRSDAVFAHRAFEVGPELEHVRYAELHLSLRSRIACDHVSALAWTAEEPTLYGVERIPERTDASLASRAALITALADRLGCARAELSVVRPALPGSWGGFGPPRVVRHGEPLAVDVSLSHDGRYAAFAAVVSG
jgi:phosphopantetheinyl transferase (holo-ACP synthase)